MNKKDVQNLGFMRNFDLFNSFPLAHLVIAISVTNQSYNIKNEAGLRQSYIYMHKLS